MAENTVFRAGLEIVPKFDRNKGKKELREAMAELKAEVNNINNNLKIGVVVDDNKLKALVKNISKTLNDMGAAFDQEKSIGYTNKLTSGLKNVMTAASDVRTEAISAVKELNKLSKYTAIAKDKSPDISKYYTDFNNTMKLPSSSVTEARNKVKELQNRLGELSALRVNINIDPKQIHKIDDAINKTSASINKIKGGLSYKSDKELIKFTPEQTYKDLYNTIGEIEKRQKSINTSTKEGVDLYNQMEVKRKSLIDVLYKEENKQKEINSIIKESIVAGKDIMKLPEKSIVDVNNKMGMLKENVEWLDMVKVELNLDPKQLNVLNSEINKSKDYINKLQNELDKNFKFKSNESLLGAEYGSSTENLLAQKEILARMKEINTTTIEGERLYSQMGEKVRKLKVEEKERVSIGNQINERLNTYIMYSQKAINMPSNSLDEAKTKIKRLKESIDDLSNIGGSVKLNWDQVTKVRSELAKAKEELKSLTKSLRGMPDANLLQMKGTSISSNNNIIDELRRRQSKLNYTTTEGSKQYQEMERRIALLNKRKQEFIGTTNGVGNAINNTTSSMKAQSSAINSLKNLARQYLGVYAVARVAQNIKDITGEFELQRVALGAIIQDQHKANQLFEEAKTQALESPFQVKDVVTYMKQLSAFQVNKNEIAETTKRLADISAGLGVDMSRIILAYGQVRAASVLRGQELRQFTEAGIPLVEKLAQKFTLLNGKLVTTSDVFGLISERKVPFEMVKDVLWDMTDAGGSFFDMQKKQAQTIKGSYSNLIDELQIAYDKIGQANYGVLKGTIDVSRQLIRLGSDNMNMISGIGVAFLTARAGTLLYNKALGEQGNEILRNIKLQKLREAQEIAINKIAGVDSTNNVSFRKRGKIDQSTLENYYVNDKLSKDTTSRLFILNKLTPEAAKSAQQVGLLNNALYQNVQALKQQVIFGTAHERALARASLGYMKLRVAISNTIVSLKAFAVSVLTNPMTWIFAAVSVISTLVMKYKEGQKAAEEFRKATRIDANENLFRLDKNINEINPDTKKDIEQINNLLKENNVEENKKLLNSEEYSQKLRNINNTLIQSVSENEFLNKMIEERLINITNELDKYIAINKAIKDYKDIMNSLSANPDLLIDIFKETDLDDTEKELSKAYENIMKNLNYRIGKGIGGSQAIALRKEIETAYTEQDWEKLNGLILKNTDKDIYYHLANSFSEAYKEQEEQLDEFTKKIKKQFDLTTKEGRDKFRAYLEEVKKDSDNKYNAIANKWEKTIFLRLGLILPEQDKIEQVSEFIAKLNQQFDKSKIFFNFKNTPERLDWGIEESVKLLKEEIPKLENELKRAENALDQNGFVYTFDNNREEDIKYISDLKKELEGLKQADAYLGGDKEKPTKEKPKGKSALELAVERIKSDIDNIKELKKRYDELLKYSSDATAKEESLALFLGLDGRSSLPKEMQSGYTEEAYISYLENTKKELEKKFKGAKKGVEISKINAEIKKIDLEIRDVKVENIKRVSDKILQDVQDELNKAKARIDLFEDMFKTTGDYNLSKNLTDMIEGAGSMDMLGGFKDNLNKVIEGAFSSDKDIDILRNLKLDVNNASLLTDFDKIMKQLPEPAQKAFETILNNYKDTSKNIIKDVLSSVEKYKDAELQKVEITAKTRKHIEEIQKLSIAKEEKDRLISISKQGEREQIAKIELQQLKESEWYTQMFSNLETTSRDVLERVREKLVSIKELNKGALDPTQMKELVNQIEKIDKILLPTKYSWKDAFIPNTEEITNAKELVTILEKQKKELELDKFEAQLRLNNPDITEEEKIAVSQKEIEIATKLTDLNNQLNVSTQDYINKINKQKEAVKTFNDQVEQLGNMLSKIQGLTGDVTSFMQGLMKVFKGKESEEFAKVMQEINDTITIAQSAYSILQTVMTTFFAIEKVGEATTIALNTAMLANPAFWVVGGIMALVGALKLYQAAANRAANNEIDNMNKALEDSDRIIKQLENSLNDLAGNDYYQTIAAQVDELEKKTIYAQRQLAAEQSKTKPDEEKVQEYTENITEYTQQAIDKQREMINDLWGDLKGVTEDLINVWLEAYKSGTNTFNALKQKFGEMIEDMIIKTIAAQVIQKHLKGVFDYVGEMIGDDGIVSTDEVDTLTQMALEASQKVNQSMSALAPFFTSIGNAFNTSLSTMGGLKEGISGASEQSISILAGYWLSHLNVTTAMAGEVSMIRHIIENNVQSSMQQAQLSAGVTPIDISDIMANQIANLVAIEANTRLNAEKVAQFYDKFSQVVIPNPNGDTAFGIKTIS